MDAPNQYTSQVYFERIRDEILKNTLEIVVKKRRGHIGTYLSSCETLIGIYFGGGFNYAPNIPSHNYRDRFVLSKAHAGLMLYCVLARAGFFEIEELKAQYSEPKSRFPVMPTKDKTPGVDMTTGILGAGLGKAIGLAIAAKKRIRDNKIVVYIGDGESSAGTIKEAAEIGGDKSLKLNNLIVVIDKNNLSLEKAIDSAAHQNMRQLWSAYGFDVVEVDGHQPSELASVMKELQVNQKLPTVIIANTIKGAGINELENSPDSHYYRSSLHKKALLKKIYQLELRLKTGEVNLKPWIESVIKNMSLVLSAREKRASQSYPSEPDLMLISNNHTTNYENISQNYELDLVKQVFEPWLVEAGYQNKKIISLSGDVAPSVGMAEFKHKFERFLGENINGRYISLPVAERTTVEIAEGLAQEGYLPVIGMYEIFVEFALADIVAMLKSHLRFIWVVTHAGLSNADGQAYQSMGASVLVSTLPDIVMVEPATPYETLILLDSIMKEYHAGSQMGYYIRLSKQPVSNFLGIGFDEVNMGFYELGTTREPEVVVITMGVITHEVLKAKKLLTDKGVEMRVIVINNLQKLETKKSHFLSLIPQYSLLVTVYDGSPKFLGDLIASMIVVPNQLHNFSNKILNLGVSGYGQSGTWKQLINLFKIDSKSIVETILDQINHAMKRS